MKSRPGMTARLMAALAGLLLLSADALATDYWVAPGGNDTNSGLSAGSAWATLQHAADLVGPGDVVHVLDGAYTGFYLDTSGTAPSPITFVAEGSDVRIVADNATTPDGINLEGASHVVIDGFIVDGRTRAGIRAVLASFVTVRNCQLGFNGVWGIFTGFVDDLLVENNVAHHSQVEHGVYVSNSADRPTIRDNVVYSNNANGLHFNGDASLGGDGLIEDAIVERNVIFDNGVAGGSGINMDGSVGGVIQNNLLYDNHASGISLYRIDAAAGASGNLVINNTIHNAADGRWCININNGSTGNTIRNNLLLNDHVFRGGILIDASSQAGFVSDHNGGIDRFSADGGSSVLSLAAWQGLGFGTGSFVTNAAALFVAPGSDFRLLATAPAVDTGSSASAPPFDLDGTARPMGAGFDVGAYEYADASCGNGVLDPGEECGEPGASCGAGQTCAACRCEDGPFCESGITLERGRVKLRAEPGSVVAKGQAVVPKPWTAVDPPTHGLRLVVDDTSGSRIDLDLPGGSAWSTNASGTRWRYVDPTGSVGGVLRAVVIDASKKEPGLLRFRVKARAPTYPLPDSAQTQTSVWFGDTNECAHLAWNPPTGDRPRCATAANKLTCR